MEDEDGIILEQKEDIMNRWKEYGAQQFERPKEEEPLVEEQIPPDEQEPPLLVWVREIHQV